MNHLKLYRWIRGGRWARVTGFIWGYRWVRLEPATGSGGAVVEQYRKRYCSECVHMRPYSWLCAATGRAVPGEDSWSSRLADQRVDMLSCADRNRHNDCRDYKEMSCPY